ncbi:MAG: nucleoside-diphosphate sugar epimerase/dehydratase [Firmicutes bacterium]|nr:nucleoside-diphosphate sugar epimerase/dehydratase [Bacillota bacterium]MDY6160881.1 nucleoside-diphosphate sugar epimerase/dehydratase [Candidatus Faecousia sp.]
MARNEDVLEMKKYYFRWQLLIYDILILFAVDLLLLVLFRGDEALCWYSVLFHGIIFAVCVFAARILGRIYQQIWRYGGIQCYIRLLIVDTIAFAVTLALEFISRSFLPVQSIAFLRLLSIASMNLLGALAIRMVYRYCFKCGTVDTGYGKFLRLVLKTFSGEDLVRANDTGNQKIKIAIIGAGRVGVNLAEELLSNAAASYIPRCFIDVSPEKAGRSIHGIPVLMENESTLKNMQEHEVQEVVFAIPDLPDEKKRSLYALYSGAGYKIKVYDFPVMQTAGKKRYLREFDIEELLFRKPIAISNDKTSGCYQDKVILITGGGGSIGSELCRQLAKMNPKQIIILDIYENGAYDVQQELKIAYGDKLDLQIEICSITHQKALEWVFQRYRPQIVINAAAHKHVPLMEKNCIEAVYNNVFGTRNLVELCEKYDVARFMMVSTDKAVNPTNVMGATKRMCEMIVQSASVWGNTKYSATRFGNVLGSAGSVIPLFKRQITSGGPVTLTDKRIVRYFMTIPEASQLVLESGAMAKNGELFVLDMGQPVKILDLAESMIRLSGVNGIEIVETGLRPGEKLYEELLVKTEKLDKTENRLIFIERDEPLLKDEIDRRLQLLEEACKSGSDDLVRSVLKQVVPTYKSPEEVNAKADQAEEMRVKREPARV